MRFDLFGKEFFQISIISHMISCKNERPQIMLLNVEDGVCTITVFNVY